MRILTFTSLFPNSQMPQHGIFVARRVAPLASRHDLKVVAPIPYFPRFFPAPNNWKKLTRVPLIEHQFGLEVSHPRYLVTPKIGMMKYGDWMTRGTQPTVEKIRNQGFDFQVIDAHFAYPDGFAAIKLGRYFNVPVVVTARGSDITRNKLMSNIAPLLREVVTSATRLIAVSKEIKQDFIELGADPEKIHVIPNGIDTSVFHPISRSEAREQLGLKQDKKLIVSVGRLDHNKSQWLILEALCKIGRERLENQKIRLALIGEGDDRRKLEEASRHLGLSDIVRFVGQLAPEKICLWNNAADVKVLASLREGSPNVVLEALACGTPVIASNVGTNPDIIELGKNGFLFPSGDSEALKNQLLTALETHWDKSVIAGSQSLRNWGIVASEAESVLEQALQEKYLVTNS